MPVLSLKCRFWSLKRTPLLKEIPLFSMCRPLPDPILSTLAPEANPSSAHPCSATRVVLSSQRAGDLGETIAWSRVGRVRERTLKNCSGRGDDWCDQFWGTTNVKLGRNFSDPNSLMTADNGPRETGLATRFQRGDTPPCI